MNFDFQAKYDEIRKHVVFAGNTSDVRQNLSNRLEAGSVSIEYLQDEIELEKKNDNRSTVIKLLETAIRKLQR